MRKLNEDLDPLDSALHMLTEEVTNYACNNCGALNALDVSHSLVAAYLRIIVLEAALNKSKDPSRF